MDRKATLYACILALALTLPAMAASSVPLLITQQGRLLDAADQPVTGTHSLTMKIYEVSSGGVALWTEVQPSVSISNGLYVVTLGSVTPISEDLLSPPSPPSPPERYLGVSVDGQTEMTPRLRLSSTPYSVSASRMDGDVVTSPGELRTQAVGQVKLARLQSSSNPGEDGSSMELLDGNGSTTGTIRASTVTGGQVYLSHSQGSTTGTIRMAATHDSAGTVASFDADGDGLPESSIKYQARSKQSESKSNTKYAFTTQSRMYSDSASGGLECSTDLNNDGVAEYSIKQKTSASAASSLLGGHSGSTTGTIRMMATPDSGNSYWDADSDDDGLSDSRVQVHVTPKDAFGNAVSSLDVSTFRFAAGPRQTVSLDGSYSHARTQCLTDLDQNGIPDVVVATESSSSGAKTKWYTDADDDGIHESDMEMQSGPGGTSSKAITTKGTGAIAMVRSTTDSTTDSGATVLCSYDQSSSGNHTRWIEELSRESVAHHMVAADLDGDGVADNTSSTDCDDTDARHVISSRTGMRHLHGGSTTATIRQSATGGGIGLDPEAVMAMEVTNSGDSHRARWLEVDMRSPAGSGNMVIAADKDDDGVADNSVSTDCDDTDARHVLTGRTGSTTATIRQMATGGGVGLDPEAVLAMEVTNSGDSHRSRWLEVDMRSPAGSGNMVIGTDTDDDGVADNTVTEDCDDTDAKIVVASSGHSGVSMVSDASGGRIAVDTIPTTHKVSIGGGGAYCDGTDWVNGSDVNAKENFQRVDGKELLNRIAALNITRWNYKGHPEVEHIGPMAQDFQAAFGVGANNTTISTIDPSGIALAAIKALQQQNQDLAKQNAQLREALENLSHKVDKLAASR